MKTTDLLFLAILAAGVSPAAAAKPEYSWVSANEYYMVLPAAQNLSISGAGTESVKPWGLGLRAVGHQTFAKTAGLQLASVKVDSPVAGRNTFYMLALLAGMQYTSPKTPGKPLRFTAAGLGEFGLSDATLYMAPVLSAGLLYTTEEYTSAPEGFTFDIYWRLADIDLDNVGGGRAGSLKSGLGVKIGYVFKGFWTSKEKAN
ncbi:MAG TPA: hypothetical protein DEQ38_07870 [Elusimicrobia bacterium]|nr:MAG: hypothetical protein A2089_06265 [Elusimicrobia bacterium GWD2_63_28]HCC48013.1 hypothetical protein [Elusimicrobiota bacterium]